MTAPKNLPFVIVWLDWEGKPLARDEIKAHDMDAALTRARNLLKRGKDNARLAYGFHVQPERIAKNA